MKRKVTIALSVLIIVLGALYSFQSGVSVSKFKKVETLYQTGDVIFQSSNAGQGRAIQLATKSKFSHVGMIFILNDEVMVFEAVQPVKLTPFDKFIARGNGKNYLVSRLKDADALLSDEVIKKMEASIAKYIDKDYDIFFSWGDDELYCSELVWKIYFDVLGIEAGERKPLRAYDLSHPTVKAIMKDRYGENIPWDEPMISPGAIFESDLFTVIRDTGC